VLLVTLYSCKPTVERPQEDEYVEVTINDGLKLDIGNAVWGSSSSRVYSSALSIEATQAETVSWDFVADVDPDMAINVNFTAGSESTGENLYTSILYKDLATTTFRVKKGTYAQVWIAPSDESMARTGSFMFAASQVGVTFDNSNTTATLVAYTTWHIVVVPVSEGTIVGQYWTDTFSINGGSEQCHYFYSNGDLYDMCVNPSDAPTESICEQIPGTSTTIYLVRVGVNSLILVDTDHITWQ
jgi:hypothetical protein